MLLPGSRAQARKADGLDDHHDPDHRVPFKDGDRLKNEAPKANIGFDSSEIGRSEESDQHECVFQTNEPISYFITTRQQNATLLKGRAAYVLMPAKPAVAARVVTHLPPHFQKIAARRAV